MKHFKLFGLALALSMVLPFCGIVGYNIYLDPDEIFRKGKHHPFIQGFPNYYRNAGIINSYEINNLIIGGSLIQNMIPSEVEEVMGWPNVFSLTFSGVNIETLSLAANYAMQKHKIDNIIFSLQPSRLARRPSDVALNMNAPKDYSYLYDSNPFNDLLTFIKLGYHLKEYKEKERALEEMRTRFPALGKREIFAASKDLYPTYMNRRFGDFNRPLFNLEKMPKKKIRPHEITEKSDRNLADNYEKFIRPMVENNPGTTFHFIFQNKTFWEFQGKEEIVAHSTRFLVNRLSGYPNVRIHSFAHNDFNADMRLFKDGAHDHIEVERYILQSIKNDWDRLTSENIDAYVEFFVQKVNDYTLPEIWRVERGKKYPKEGYITYYDAAKLVWGERFNDTLFKSIPRSPYLAEETYVQGDIKTSPSLKATRQELERGRSVLTPQ